MEGPLRHGSWKVAKVFGIPIRIHFSWIIIFGLFSWSLSVTYFPEAVPGRSSFTYWASGIVAACLLFLSVVLHEISHSLTALRYRILILDITLFIFGGVAQMKGEPPDPKAELRISLAGPAMSLFLSVLFFVLSFSVQGEILRALLLYVAQLNFMLCAFNLIPGFPMDGGRVVRAVIWRKTGDFLGATRRAALYGQRIALVIIFAGLVALFSGLPGGLWVVLIGWFLHTAAGASLQQASLQGTLSGVRVRDIMVRDFISLTPETTIGSAVNDYFLRYGYGGFPVIENGKFLGFLTLREVKNIDREQWTEARVSEVYVPHEQRLEVSADDDAFRVLEKMIHEDTGRLVVIDKGTLAGMITRNGIARYVQIMGR